MIEQINKFNKQPKYKKTNEYKFYDKYRGLYKNTINSFIDVIDANIIIKGLINRQKIQAIYESYKRVHADLTVLLTYEESRNLFNKHLEPYLNDMEYFIDQDSNQRVFLPFYDSKVNNMFETNMILTDVKQYHLYITSDTYMSDFKQLYNNQVYNSIFTNFEYVFSDNEYDIFYHPEMKTLYRFTKQIILHDYLVLNDVSDEAILKQVAQLYINDEYVDLIDCMYEKQIITTKGYKKLMKKVKK